MKCRRRVAGVVACLLGLTVPARAQTVESYTVLVQATVRRSPPEITLQWTADPLASSYTVSRKAPKATSWGPGTPLGGAAVSFVDANVSLSSSYEYRIEKQAQGYTGTGYICVGLDAPLVDERGKMILLVDDSFSVDLASELSRLEEDLWGDGWEVVRHDVSRSASVPQVKSLIAADYAKDPSRVSTVFLLGHVPVPYSGDLAPDGHPDHKGAWPADVFYADTKGSWSDTTVNTTSAASPANRNVPGDGKYDPSTLPASLTLCLGRVDLANLPAFSKSEKELLRQYLNKDHAFRFGLTTLPRRGLVVDHFGTFNGEAFAVNGFSPFTAFFGSTNVIASPDWFSTLGAQGYLWGYACGAGDYTSAQSVGATKDFAATDTRVAFTMLFGSYFGDWNVQDDFLRAPLATTTYTLASLWAGRPRWHVHHMGLGEPIGFSTRLSQNNDGTLYAAPRDTRGVHMALHGDPTLRMHPVLPPSSLKAQPKGSDLELAWSASPDTVIGYHVYRASQGRFTRLTSSLVTGTTWTDTAALSTSTVYMVRAVKLESTGSGTYENPSQGVFALASTTSAPSPSPPPPPTIPAATTPPPSPPSPPPPPPSVATGGAGGGCSVSSPGSFGSFVPLGALGLLLLALRRRI